MLAAILRHSPDVRLLRTCLGGVRATHSWEWMRQQGHEINPCNSKHHPAVKAGIQPAADQTPVQEAYTPSSICWGCGERCTVAVPLCLIHCASVWQSSKCLRCACWQQIRSVQTMDTSAPEHHVAMVLHVDYSPHAGPEPAIAQFFHTSLPASSRSPKYTRPEAEKLSSRWGPRGTHTASKSIPGFSGHHEWRGCWGSV